MASFLFFIFTILLLLVARPADSKNCSVCESDSGYRCNGAEEVCAEKAECLGVSSNTRLSNAFPSESGHPLTKTFSRTCVDPANNLTGSFYFDFGNVSTLDFTSKVCDEKDLNCDFPPLVPPIRKYENGKSCPRCFRTGYDNCDTNGEVRCVGDLVDCTVVNGEITHEYSDLNLTTTIPFAGKGCVSQSVCKLGGKSFRLGSYTFTFKDLTCSKANGALSSLRRLAFTLEKKDLGPQVAFFFPCILGIFAVKILS